MDKLEGLIKSHLPPLRAFQEYCSLIENHSSILDSSVFLRLLRSQLLDLYSEGLKLSPSYIPSEKEYDDVIETVSTEPFLKAISTKLENSRYYWEVFDPTKTEEREPVCGDLIDDIFDIYEDLKETLLVYSLNTEDAQATAMWQFEFQFRTHWGDHCINALRAIHYFLTRDSFPATSPCPANVSR